MARILKTTAVMKLQTWTYIKYLLWLIKWKTTFLIEQNKIQQVEN